MSLVAWYPLNGDGYNHGINDNNEISCIFTANGKTGAQCANLTNSRVDLGYDHNLASNITLSGWFYFDYDIIKPVVEGLTYNSKAYFATGGLLGYNSYKGVGLVWATNNIYSSTTFSSLSVCAYHRDSGYSATSDVGIPDKTWVHLAVSVNYSTKLMCIYKNGILQYTASIEDASNTVRLYLNYNGVYAGNGPSSYLPYKCNDIRIYDEVLSEKEIKEISKGLILHYPMNRIDGVIGGRNLIINTSDEYKSIKVGQWYGTLASFDMQQLMERYNLVDGDILTYSVIFKSTSTKGVRIRWQKYNSSDDRTGSIGTKIIKNGEGKLSIQIPIDSSYSELHLLIQNGDTSIADSTTEYYKCIKLERGSIATPWTPAPEDGAVCANDNTIYDVSGYGNHGIVTTTSCPTWSNESIIGNGSYSFLKNNNIICDLTMDSSKSDYTITFWNKMSSHNNMPFAPYNNGNLNFYYNIGLYLNTGDGANNPFIKENGSTYNYSLNAWTHYAFVYTASAVKLYINGEYTASAKTYIKLNTSQFKINGWYANNMYNTCGLINDYKIYATALSDNDIKELYQTRYSLSNKGILFCNEINEIDSRENLLQEYIRAGGRTTKIDDNSIIIGTGSDVGDTYFYLRTTKNLTAGTTYTLMCYADNVPDDLRWTFCGNNSTASNMIFILNKNGLNYCTFSLGTDITANTDYIIDDSNGRPSSPPNIHLYNFKLVEGSIDEPQFNSNGNIHITNVSENDISSAKLYKEEIIVKEIIEK